MAKQATSTRNEDESAAGISASTPKPPATMRTRARPAHAPAPADEGAGDAAPEEVAEVGGEERDPEAERGLLEPESAWPTR